jgi:AAA+ superfamily predicted ATPase
MEPFFCSLKRLVKRVARPVELFRLRRASVNTRAMRGLVKASILILIMLVSIALVVLLWLNDSRNHLDADVGLVLQETFGSLMKSRWGHYVLGAIGAGLPTAVAARILSLHTREVPSPLSARADVPRTESHVREKAEREDDRASAERHALNDRPGRELGCVRYAKTLDDIVMSETSRNTLRAIAVKLRQRRESERKGCDLPHVLFFWGPRGTGKRLSAMALATASGYGFWTVSGEQVLADPSVWNRVLLEAGNRLPAIVFLDSAEAVLSNMCLQECLSLKQRLMRTLDGTNDRTRRLLFVCATHDPGSLDPALLHGATRAQAIQFELPGRAALASYVRLQIRAMAADVFAVSRFTIEYTIDVLARSSFAEADEVLRQIHDVAARRYFHEGVAIFTQADVRAALCALRYEVGTQSASGVE